MVEEICKRELASFICMFKVCTGAHTCMKQSYVQNQNAKQASKFIIDRPTSTHYELSCVCGTIIHP
jgi:hypothetical protein